MIRMGIYRHYKGPLYQVLGVAHDANAEDLASRDSLPSWLGERFVVVYIALQLDLAKEGPRLAVRTVEDFEAYVHLSTGNTCQWHGTGSTCLVGDCVLRFKFLGNGFHPWMLEAR